MSVEDILNMVVALARECGMSRPLRLRVDFEREEDRIEVPFSVARPREANVSVSAVAPSPVVPVAREPKDVEDAIRVALFHAGCCRTGPELILDVQRLWPGRWEDASISNQATRMSQANGSLFNRRTDARDGLGRGYGLVGWETKVEITEN